MTDLLIRLRNMQQPPKSRNKRAFSIVWVVPIVALLIGGWLAFKAISEKGPTITITFVSGRGAGGRQNQNQVPGRGDRPGRADHLERGYLAGGGHRQTDQGQ